ncbi:hypothetical protein [Halanaerobium congolense]|uniref:Uncharacterized protein n=1 Tax=Halanaerobium congolense TaxID=54121 RepID=A0A4R7EFN5_9FIRM|nr:hypothetical protein [Halanaerobium congolense]TDS31737.1 hypothetical protein BY453_10942 [Halanaerobium congolense]
MKIKKDEHGFVLVLSMFILVAILLMVAGMTRMLQSELDFYTYNSNQKKAFYAAEAAVAYGTAVFDDSDKRTHLNQDQSTDPIYELSDTSEVNSYLDMAKVDHLEWEFKDNYSIVEFRAKASNNGVSEEVIASYSIYNSIFDSALASGNTISLGNSHIISNGVIKTKYTINGEIYDEAGNLVEITPDENLVIPEFNFETLNNQADNIINIDGGTIEYVDLAAHNANDNITETDDVADEFTYIDGNLNIGNSIKNINGSGIIVVDGKLSIGNNLLINQEEGYEDDYLILIVKGSIDTEGVVVEGDNAITMQGLLYSYGDTVFGNKFNITGSLISGGNLTLNNSSNNAANIAYDPKFIEKLFEWNIDFPQSTDNNFSIYQIKSWREN